MFALQPLPELMTQRLAWVLVHFIWQGTLIAFLLAAVAGLARFRHPTTRYAASMLALLAMIACPVVTFFCVTPAPALPAAVAKSGADESPMLKPPRVEHSVPSESNHAQPPALTTDVASDPAFQPIAVPVAQSGVVTTPTPSTTQQVSVETSLWHRTQPWIVAGWFVGVGLLSLRLLLGWIGVWRLRRRVQPAPQWVVDRMQRMAGLLRAGLPLVRLSQHVTEAIAVGFLKPMILLPIAWVTELSPDMLDAVIAHELAHIRRGDLWVNLLQRLVETLLFYHPAVWWLSRRLRIERELCCDELVVKVTQNRLRYAETLEHIGRLSLVGSKSVLTVSIMGNRSVLLDRIRHILNLEPRDRSANIWLAGVLPLLVAGLIWWSAVALQGNAVKADDQTSSTSKETTAKEPDKQTTAKTPASNDSSVATKESAAEKQLIVKGRVVDDVTGQPIERVSWVSGMVDPKQSNRVAWGYSYQAYAELDGGHFEKSLNWHMGDRERVLVGGYEPKSILDALPAVIPANRTIEVTVRLKRGRTIHGFVKDHNGAPAKSAKVFYIPEGHRSNIAEGIPGANDYDFRDPALSHHDLAVMEVATDNDGKFTIPTEGPGHAGRLAVSTLEIDVCPFPAPADGQPVELKLPAPATLEIDWSFWYLDAMEKAKVNPWDTDDPRYCVLHLVRLGGDRDDWKGVSYQRTMLVLGPPQSTVKLSRGVTQDVKNDESLPALPDGRVNRALKGTTTIVGLPAGHYEISRKRGYQMLATESVEIVTGQVTKLERKAPQGATVFGSVSVPENSVFKRQEDEPSQALTLELAHYRILSISNAKQGQERRQLDSTTVGPNGKFEFRTHLPPGDYIAHLSAYLPESDVQRQFSTPIITPDLAGEAPFTIPERDSTPVEITIKAESHTSRITAAPLSNNPPAAGAGTQLDNPIKKPGNGFVSENEKQSKPWAVHGQVVGADGKPMTGVTVTASAGHGSLKQTGNVETDQEGRYEFRFGPGILHANDPVQLQAALITAHKPGFFEKTLSRQGELLAARIMPSGKLNRGAKTTDDVILPDAPREVNFVMLPAAKVSGTLIDENEKPLVGYDVSLRGEQMPPGSSVIDSAKSDDKGHFKLEDIPTGFKYQFLIQHPSRDLPRTAWGSGPLEFKDGRGDEIFLQEPEREVEANRFELQVKGPGVGWRTALKIGHLHQKLEPHGDYLTGVARLHAATLRLELNSPTESPAEKPKPPANGDTPKPAPGNPEKPTSAKQKSNTAAGPIRFEGVVRNIQKRPLPRADVVLCLTPIIDGRQTSEVIATGRADDNGAYSIDVPEAVRQRWLPTTEAAVWAMADGYAPGIILGAAGNQVWQASADVPKVKQPAPVDPDDEDATEDEPPEPDEGGLLYPEQTVDVEISDERGQPLIGRVRQLDILTAPVPPQFTERMVSGQFQGKLAIKHMPAGHSDSSLIWRSLWVQSDSHGLVQLWWNADSTSEREGRVAEGRRPVKLTTQPAARVTGQLVIPGGGAVHNLVANVQVELLTHVGDSSPRGPWWCEGHATVKTDATGRFEVPRLSSGKLVHVRVRLRNGTHRRADVAGLEQIMLQPGETKHLEIPLVATRAVVGVVRRPNGEGIPNIGFLVMPEGRLQPPSTFEGMISGSWNHESVLTDAEGRFSFEQLPGTVSLTREFSPRGGLGTTAGLWPDSKDLPARQPGNFLTIPAAQDPLVLPPIILTEYQGTLLDEAGKPLEGVVLAHRAPAVLGLARSNADGKFEIAVVGKPTTWTAAGLKEQSRMFGLPGEKAPNVLVMTEAPLVLRLQSRDAAKPPAVGASAPPTEPKPETPAPPQTVKFAGLVLDAAKKPLVGANVWLVVERDGTGYNIEPRVIQEGKTGANGEFQFLAPKPEIQLSTVWVVGTEHELGWKSSTGDVVNRAADQFVVQCSSDPTVIRVVDPTNKPVEGATVALLSFNRRRFPVQVPQELNAALFTKTDAEGNVRFSGIPADAIVSAEVQAPGWGRQSLPSGYADPWATSSKELTITLRPVGRIEGQLKARSADGSGEKLSVAGVKFQLVSGAAEFGRRAVGRAEVTTDADGRFVVPAMAEGSLQLAGRPAVDQTPRVVIERVAIDKGLTVQLAAQLMSPTRVHGIVRTEDTKKPAADFSLYIDHEGLGRSTEEWRLTTKTNADGMFEVYLPPGKITLYQRSHLANYTDVSRHSESRPNYLISAGLAQLELPPWELSPAITQKGRLVDRDGKPLVGWNLDGFPTSKPNTMNCCNSYTGEDGTFEIDYPKRFPPVLFKVRNEDYRTNYDLDDKKPFVEIIEKDPLVLKVNAEIISIAPPRKTSAPAASTDPKGSAVNKPADVVEAQLPAHDLTLQQRVFDFGRMELISIPFYGAGRQTGLQFDRVLQDLGLGDTTWVGKTRQVVGLRGARLLLLDAKDWPAVEALKLPVLRETLAQKGLSSVTLPENATAFLALATREGHIAIVRCAAADKSVLTIQSRRLTKTADVAVEQANDGIEQVAWGPVVDGWQAGSVYREVAANRPAGKHSIGDLVQMKVFVRNAGSQARDYSWQREKRENPLPARLPRLEHWLPVVVDAQGQRAITGTEPYHSSETLQTVTLQPSEAVLVGTASCVLWPSVDVGFGVYPNQQMGVVVAPGQHRLVMEFQTGLVNGPTLRTGELVLEVQAPDKSQVESLTVLDAIEHLAGNDDDNWIGWRAPKPTRRTRSTLSLTPAERQIIPCQAFDAETKQPVAGAVATVEFFVWGPDQSNDHLCKYAVLTDAEGRFDMQIPRPLLRGYLPDWKPDFRVNITHPNYTEAFESKTLDDLLKLKLIAADGSVHEPGPRPALGAPLDRTKFASFQAVAVKPARTISGRLLGAEKRPLPNVTIYGSNSLGWPMLVGSPRTDAEGRFRFNIPAKQTVKLEFRSGLGRSFVTTKPEQTDLGDVLAVPGVKVRGRVLDRAGQPVAHVSVTTPAWPDVNSQPNFVQRTDDNGWFESDLLAPGEYQTEVGDIVPPASENEPRLTGLPPDLYLPVRFTVQAGKPVADLKLSPAEFAAVTSTLITTVPKPPKGKLPDAIDPLYWRVVKEKTRREREKLEADKKAGVAESDNGDVQIVLGETPEEQQDIMMGWVKGFSRSPMINVSGTLQDQPWKRTQRFQELNVEIDPPTHSFKLPRELTEVTFEAGDYVQHLQLGAGPKLFGKMLRISKTDVDQLDLKIYRYRPTTLKVVFLDAAGKPVAFKGDELPSDLKLKTQYVREAEVRQAGASFESSESLMSRWVLDNSIVHFVLPGEEIELAVTQGGKLAPAHRITLQEGETRTLTVSLNPELKWTEKSVPTPVE